MNDIWLIWIPVFITYLPTYYTLIYILLCEDSALQDIVDDCHFYLYLVELVEICQHENIFLDFNFNVMIKPLISTTWNDVMNMKQDCIIV